MKCSNCGSVNPANAKFCQNCGIELNKAGGSVVTLIVLFLLILGCAVYFFIGNHAQNGKTTKRPSSEIKKEDVMDVHMKLEEAIRKNKEKNKNN